MRSENGRGQSALHLAALAQSPETLELLLTKGEFPPPDDVQGVQEKKETKDIGYLSFSAVMNFLCSNESGEPEVFRTTFLKRCFQTVVISL